MESPGVLDLVATSLPTAAGFVSSSIFVFSAVPMVVKALRTRDLRSYSFVNLTLANVGNCIYWIYVTSLPLGPVWAIHGFNSLVTLTMLISYLRYKASRLDSAASSRKSLDVSSFPERLVPLDEHKF